MGPNLGTCEGGIYLSVNVNTCLTLNNGEENICYRLFSNENKDWGGDWNVWKNVGETRSHGSGILIMLSFPLLGIGNNRSNIIYNLLFLLFSWLNRLFVSLPTKPT